MFQGENSGAHTVFVAATAATVAMHEAGSTGNTDRQQSDSRVSAEGKGDGAHIKKNGQELQVPRLAGREEGKERGQLEK